MKWLAGVPCLLNQQGQARVSVWIIQVTIMLHSQRNPGTLSMQVKQIYQEACLPAVFCCNGLYSRQFQQKCHVSAHHTITGWSICFTSGSLPSREGVGGHTSALYNLDHTLHSLLRPARQNASVNTYISHRLAHEWLVCKKWPCPYLK